MRSGRVANLKVETTEEACQPPSILGLAASDVSQRSNHHV